MDLGRTDHRALLSLHIGFAALSGTALALSEPAKGWAILAAVIAYNVALPLTARAVGRDDWLRWWAFLLPVSIFQVLPDWVLVEVAGTLVFPDIGGLRVGDAIGLQMAGLWVTPLFLVLLVCGGPDHPGRAAAAAVVIFLGSELMAPVLDLWEPRGATEVAGVALYVLPAEAVLGLAVALGFRFADGRPWPQRWGIALGVATLYTGALLISLLLIDAGSISLTT